jgi:putative FmdB family regulatory protein
MPVYEYICKACDHEFEREQRISDRPVKKCPACGAMKAKRLISRTSFVLKGGGWYSDLYSSSRGDSGKRESDAEGSSSSGKRESGAEGSSSSEPSSTPSSSSDKKDDSSKGSKAAA